MPMVLKAVIFPWQIRLVTIAYSVAYGLIRQSTLFFRRKEIIEDMNVSIFVTKTA